MADCVDDLLFVRNEVSFEGSVNLNLLQVLKCCKSLQWDVGHIMTGMGSVSRHYSTWTPGRDLGAVSNLSVPAVFLKLPKACCVLTLILPSSSLLLLTMFPMPTEASLKVGADPGRPESFFYLYFTFNSTSTSKNWAGQLFLPNFL